MNAKNDKRSKSRQKNTDKLSSPDVPNQKIVIAFLRAPPGASKSVARPIRTCPPDAFGLINQEVVIELVDEEPTKEMMSARERFWQKVFAELLPPEEESPVKAKRKKQ